MATLSPTSNKEQIFYQTYTPYMPAYMSGYTGHIPHVQKEEFINRIVHTKHIPGYMGFVSSIKAENKFEIINSDC